MTEKKLEVEISADSRGLASGLDGARQSIGDAIRQIESTQDIKLSIDMSHIRAQMAKVAETIKTSLASTLSQVKINIDSTSLQAELASTKALINSSLTGANNKIKLGIDQQFLRAAILQAKAAISSAFTTAHSIVININMAALQSQLATAAAQIRSLVNGTAINHNIRLGIDMPYLQAQLASALAMVRAAIIQMASMATHITLTVNINAAMGTLVNALKSLEAEVIRLRLAILANPPPPPSPPPGGGGGGGAGASFIGNLGAMGAVLAIAQVAQLGKAVIETSDKSALLNARLKDLLGTDEAVTSAKDKLYESAQRLGVGFGDMTGATARMIPAMQEMGNSSDQAADKAIKLSEILAVTAKLSGSTAQEAAASAQQFSQSLGSGVLQGDELKSILENNQSLARSLANALKLPEGNAKVTLGMLKQLGADGKITSKIMSEALLNSYDAIMAKADQLPRTFEGTWTRIKNVFFKVIDDFNKASLFSGVIDEINNLAKQFEQLGKDGTLLAWGKGISEIMGAVGGLFKELLSIVGDVLSEIAGLWGDLTGSIEQETGAQITIFDILKGVIDGIRLVFIAARAVITGAMVIVRLAVQEAVSNMIDRFIGFSAGFQTAATKIGSNVQYLAQLLKMLATVAFKALTLDFAGAVSAWDAGTQKLTDIVTDKARKIAAIEDERKRNQQANNDSRQDNRTQARDKLGDIGTRAADSAISALTDPETRAPIASKSYSGGSIDQVSVGAGKEKKGKAAKSQVTDFEKGLEQQKLDFDQKNLANNSIQDFPIQKEVSYWQQILATRKLSADERLQVEKKLTDAQKKLTKEVLDSIARGDQDQLERNKYQLDAKKGLLQDSANFAKKTYGENSDQYRAAQDDIKQIDDQIAEKKAEDARHVLDVKVSGLLAGLDFDKQASENELAIGLITQKEMLTREQWFEDQRYLIKKAALDRRLEIWNTENKERAATGGANPDDRQSIVDDGSKLNQDKKSTDQGINQKKIEESASWIQDLSGNMSSLWDKGLQSMLDGTLTWKNAMQGLFADVGMFFIQKVISEPLKKQAAMLAISLAKKMGFISADVAATVTGETVKTGAHVAGEVAKTTATATGTTARTSMGILETIASIMRSAWEAMAKAWASIPPPFGAVVGAVAFASVAAMAGKVASARGGYDIPSGVNPMTQLHEEEMVLPKQYANVIRDMAAGNGGGDGGASQAATGGGDHYHIHALDARSFERYLKSNGGALVGALKTATRNGNR